MGIYDSISYSERCGCGRWLNDWQSKSGNCLLEFLTAYDLMLRDNLKEIEMHTYCPICQMMHERTISFKEAQENVRATSVSWNYRIVHRLGTTPAGYTESIYAVHEVHYNRDNDPVSCTLNAVSPYGETIVELRESISLFNKAFTKSVLEYENF